MEKYLKRTFITLTLITLLFIPSAVKAQNNFDQTQLNETALGAGTDTTITDSRLNNLWWILPLVALPLIFYIVTRTADDDGDREGTVTYRYSKGGKAERKSNSNDKKNKN